VAEDVGHEIHARSHRTAAAAHPSPAVSARMAPLVRQSEAPVLLPLNTVRSQPRSR
jgi:hypothetical protein